MRLTSRPVLLNYYLTYRCNASCGFCDIWEKPSPYATIENVKENLSAAREMGVKIVDFTGGEPLLHKELPLFLDIAKELGFLTTVTTNTLLYPKHSKALAGKIDMLHFSLDSIDKEKHNESRRVNCYDHLIQSIEISRELGEKPDILFTVTEKNVDEIEAVYDRFVRQENLHLILNPIFAYGNVGESLSPESLEKLRGWTWKPGVYLNQAFLDLRENGGNHVSSPVCKAASTTLVISPENKLVLPCYHLGEKEFQIEGNLKGLYETKEVQALVELEGKLPGCEGCTVNCYMEPSMAVELNSAFLSSAKSTVKYSLEKWVYA